MTMHDEPPFSAKTSARIIPASMVFPKPVSSAMSNRRSASWKNFSKGLSWNGLKSMFARRPSVILPLPVRARRRSAKRNRKMLPSIPSVGLLCSTISGSERLTLSYGLSTNQPLHRFVPNNPLSLVSMTANCPWYSTMNGGSMEGLGLYHS